MSNKKDAEVECNLENELSQDDEVLLKKVNLTQEQIKLKGENQEAFWKSIAETLRSDLRDALDDNQEVCSLLFVLFFYQIILAT